MASRSETPVMARRLQADQGDSGLMTLSPEDIQAIRERVMCPECSGAGYFIENVTEPVCCGGSSWECGAEGCTGPVPQQCQVQMPCLCNGTGVAPDTAPYVPALLDEVERLRNEVDVLKEAAVQVDLNLLGCQKILKIVSSSDPHANNPDRE